jgi:hypothetical protein
LGKRSDGVAGSPLVGPTGVVDAGRGDDVAAVSSDVDPGSEAAGAVVDVPAGVGEPVMATAASGVNRQARRECPVAALEFGQGPEAVVVGIDVEHDEPAVATGAEGHVGCRPLPPPAGDGVGVSGGVAEALPGAGVLRRAGAVGPTAGAA